MQSDQDLFFETLYRTYYVSLLHRAEKELGDKFLAQDATQDTFHTAWNRLDKLMAHENPKAWLNKVLDHKIMHIFQERARDYARLFSIEDENYVEPGEPDQEIMALEMENSEVLEKIQESLKPEEFRFLTRLVLDGASHQQLSEEFHLTIYGSKKRRERILKKLNKLLPDIREKTSETDEKERVQ